MADSDLNSAVSSFDAVADHDLGECSAVDDEAVDFFGLEGSFGLGRERARPYYSGSLSSPSLDCCSDVAVFYLGARFAREHFFQRGPLA